MIEQVFSATTYEWIIIHKYLYQICFDFTDTIWDSFTDTKKYSNRKRIIKDYMHKLKEVK